MKTKIRFFSIFSALLASTLLFAGEPTAPKTILKMKVGHLACSECVEKFKSALSKVCTELTLDIQTGEALCRYESPATPETILSKANKTGLPTKIIK